MDNIKENDIPNVLSKIVCQYKDKIPTLIEIFAKTVSISTNFFDERSSENVIKEIFAKFIKTSNNEELNDISTIAETPKTNAGSLNHENNPSEISNILAPKSPDLHFNDDDDDDDSTYIPETQMDQESSEDFLFVAPSELNTMQSDNDLHSQLVVDFMDIDDKDFTSVLSKNNMNKSIDDMKCTKQSIENELTSSTEKKESELPADITSNANENRDDCRSATPDINFEHLDDENDNIANVTTSNGNKSEENKFITTTTTTTSTPQKSVPNHNNRNTNEEEEVDFNMAQTQMFDITKISIAAPKSPIRLLNVVDDIKCDPYMAVSQIFEPTTIQTKTLNSTGTNEAIKCHSPFLIPDRIPSKAKNNNHQQSLNVDPNLAETKICNIADICNASKSPARLDDGDGENDDDPYMAATQIFEPPSMPIKKSNETNEEKCNLPFLLPKRMPPKAKTNNHQQSVNTVDICNTTKSPVRLHDDDEDPNMAATQIFEPSTIPAKKFKSNDEPNDGKCNSPFLLPNRMPPKAKKQPINIDPNLAETQIFDIETISNKSKSPTRLGVIVAGHDDDDEDPYLAATQIFIPPTISDNKINSLSIQPKSPLPSNNDISNKEIFSIESKNNNSNNISNSKYVINYNDKLFDDSMDFLKDDNDDDNNDNKPLCMDETQMFVQNDVINNEPSRPSEADIYNVATQLEIVPSPSKLTTNLHDNLPRELKSDKENLLKKCTVKLNKPINQPKAIRNNNQRRPSDDVVIEVDTPQFALIKDTKPHKIIKAEAIYQNMRKQLPKKPLIFKDSSDDDDEDNDNDDHDKYIGSEKKETLQVQETIIKNEPINVNIKKNKKFIHKVPSSLRRPTNDNNSVDDSSDVNNSNSKKININGVEPEIIVPKEVQMNRRKSATSEFLSNKEQSTIQQPLRTSKRSKTIDTELKKKENAVKEIKNDGKRQQKKPPVTSTNVKATSSTISSTTIKDTVANSKLLSSRKINICDLFGEDDSDGGGSEENPTRPKRARKAIILAECTSHKEEKLRTKPPAKVQKTYTGISDNSPSNIMVNAMDVRRSNRSKKPRILFTQIDPTPFTNVIQSLGGYVVDSPDKCDILITNKIYRTYKFLSAIGKGAQIVDVSWLREVLHSNRFVKTDKYSLCDIESEKRYKFNLKKSLEIARSHLLFNKYSIYVTPNTKPLPMELKAIIECAGGVCLLDIKQLPSHPNDKIIAVSSKEDYKLWPIYKKKYPSMIIINTEGFMLSIMRQYICFDSYTFKL